MSKYLNIVFIVFNSLLFVANSFAQSESVSIKVYGFEEGLTHRNVFKIQQDHEGFIWIATINGLNKFDGHRFVQYSSNQPELILPYDYVSDLVVDRDSQIWLASPNYLVMLKQGENTFETIRAEQNSSVYQQPRSFNCLNVDENGKLVVATQLEETGQSFIQRLNDKNKLEDVLEVEGGYAKRALLVIDGAYYVSFSENELVKTDTSGKVQKTYSFPETIKGNKSIAWINHLQRSENGTIWALLNNGQVYYLKPGEHEFIMHSVTNDIFNRGVVSTMLIEDNGDIWIGGMGNLWFYEAETGQTINFDPSVKDIVKNTCSYRQIFKDVSGVIWVASDYGAIKIVKSQLLFSKYLDEGSDFCSSGFCSMRGITEDEAGNIYFSYYNSIHVLDANTNTIRPLFPRNDYFNFPFGLLYHDQALYTGNGRRIDLNTLEVDSLILEKQVDLGYPMLDHEGEIWMGFRKNIYIYNPKNRKVRLYQDPQNRIDTSRLDVSFLYQSKFDQSIWLCTLEDGLYKLDKEKGVIGHYNTDSLSQPRLRHNKINGVFEDHEGNLWIGSGDGLHHWDLSTNRLKIYDEKSGLKNSFINGLLPEGDSAVWISTDNGLARIDLKTASSTGFYKQDGLSANEFNRSSFYLAKNGRMYFGGLNGVNAFYPSSDLVEQKLQRNSKVLFSGFSKLDGENDSVINRYHGLSPKKPIELSYKDRFFSFEFALANFKNPGSNTYSYKLDGFEEDWSMPTQINIAKYNAIPAGEYTFRVRAANGPGNWNKEELKVRVLVQEAFYKSWWFLAIAFLAALAVTAGVLEYRLYLSKQRRKELEREVKARTLELEREKRKSDELLLNILPAETANELKQFGKAKAKRYDHVTVLFTDFKGFTKIAEQLSPEDLVAEIDFCFKNFDTIIEKYGLEKIKTIGDAYMCVGGMPKPDINNPIAVINAAIDIRDFMLKVEEDHKIRQKPFFEIRLGVHTGDVVAGIVGTKKFVYDIWGDAVNIAARMEDSSDVGKVNVSGTTQSLIEDHFEWTYRGKVAAKNKGEVDMYFAERK